MGTAEKDGGMGPFWASSTNWLVASGSLEGSITLVTSSSAAEDGDVIPTGVLLERPPDSPPCEITISFREKHEIHSIYVRSTAKIYEIYYASDKKVNSNEYLHTVRCGAAVSEEINEVLPRSDSNNAMEDGWVEIKVPGSIVQENSILSLSNVSGENILSPLQIQYEATAEISDSCPCLSVTLRLLSHQIKSSIQIEEIYIFADLIEDNNQAPPACNIGSLLSTLVPGILHLSRSGSFPLNSKGLSDATAGSKFSCPSDRAIDASFLDMSEISEVATSSMMGNSIVGLDPYNVSKLKTEKNIGSCDCAKNALDEPIVKHTQTKPAEVKKGSDQSLKAKNHVTNDAFVRLEKILGDLVSRVGRIESFCSSFQESILKPLTGINTRLQQIEERLDTISKVAPLSSETDTGSRLSCHLDHNSNLKNENCISLSATTESSSHDNDTTVDTLTVPLPESLKSSGLIVKAPEFPDDDDDDESASNDNFIDLTPKEYPKKVFPLPIDRALASELAAFITSNTDKSCVHKLNTMDVPNEQQISDNHFIDSANSAVFSVVESVLEDKNCDVPYETRDKTIQGDKSYYDAHGPDSKLMKNDSFEITEAKPQHVCLCDESPLPDDDLSHTHGPKGLIISIPEFPCEDDILDCKNVSDCDSPYAHSNALSDPGYAPPLALFLSSKRSGSSRGSSNPHDDSLEPSSDDIDSFVGVVPDTGQNSRNPETMDAISQMKSLYDVKQVLSFILEQNDLTSKITFNADKTLKSWLPLEVLLSEKSDDKGHNCEYLAGDLDINVDENFTNEFPFEIRDEKSDDQIESSDYDNDNGIGQQPNPLKALSFFQISELVDDTLLDMTSSVDQSEVSGMLKAGTPKKPECFSDGQPFSSLI